jgi:D-alanyl-D-alanine carboxypeptidase
MSDNALFPPGEGAHYSDTNYLLLGLIIEAVRGNSLHDELATGIFKPLGMRDTYMSYAYSQPEPGPRLSDWYLGDVPMVSSGADSSWDWGGGGIVSTAADLNTFIQHLFAGHLFKHQSTLDLMLTPNRLKEEKGVLTLGYGLGIRYSQTPVGPMWGHAGAWGAQMQFFPEHGLSVAGTINSYTGTATGLSYELTFQLAEMALKAK